MVVNIRRKFVIVTTSLMVVVFGILITVNYFYNEHWECVDTASMLEWFAKTGIFTSENYDVRGERMLMEISEGEPPFAGLFVDEEGKIFFQRVIGSSEHMTIPDSVIQRVLQRKGEGYKIGDYIYNCRRLEEGYFLIVIMNRAFYKNSMQKIISGIFFILAGVAVLVLLTFVLSGFVTRPAKQALLREKQFISDASHELKTPLSAICINAQALSSRENENLYIKNIISESQRMARLIERLLTLSRLEEKENIERNDFSFSEVCEEMVLTYDSIAYEKKFHYEYQIDPDISMQGNEDEIRQLIAILVDNALKHTPESGKIRITCQKNRDEISMKVMNTGKGIEEKDLPHVFERFYTSDISRNKDSFGLGLAIAKAIVERHQGKIYVTSKPGEETIFHVKW